MNHPRRVRLAHAAGVIHRDIKPANLYLAAREDGEIIVKVLDFGVAKVKQQADVIQQDTGLTQAGTIIGSPLYMSPEQAKGLKTTDHRTDIWGLGSVLYEALAGRAPYGHARSLGELVSAVTLEPPPPIQQFAPWVTPEVLEIVHGALRSDPADRFPSALAMLEAIRRLTPQGLSIQIGALVSLSPAERAAVAPSYTPSYTAPWSIPFRRSSAITGATGDLSTTGPAPDSRSAPISVQPAVEQQAAEVARPRRGLRAAIIGLGALVCVGVGVLFSYLLVGRDPARPPAPAGSAPPVEPVERTPPPIVPSSAPLAPASALPTSPSGEPAASSSAPAPAADLPERVVRVTIVPTYAKVDIDGRPVPVKNGAIEIRGPLGSAHRVRVQLGKREMTGEVTITEAGPAPPLLELPLLKGPASGARPAPSP